MLIKEKLLENKQNLIDQYVNGCSFNKLSAKYGCSYKTIINFFKKEKIPIKNRSESCRRHSVKHDFFSIIDTEEKAYFLGFLYADGYNQKDKNIVRMNLHEKDKKILEKLTNIIQPSKKLYYSNKKKQYSIQIVSEQMCTDLNYHGCVQAKTKILTFPKTVPNNLIRHFIRGYFDGDGCIHIKQKENNKITGFFILLGTFDMIFKLQENFQNQCNTKTKKIYGTKKKNIILYRITYCSKSELLNIREFLYKDSNIYLDRKRYNFYLL